ncbi:MAG: hypothetical protein LBF28_00245 [Rickettsiales bacterium]|jgi:predicted transcriptional regulator of viral defense system|nr:hypothetical protein [Rickettsiales bacterium]
MKNATIFNNDQLSKIEPPLYIGGWSAANHWGLLDDYTLKTFVFCHKTQAQRQLVSDKLEIQPVSPHLFYGLIDVGGAALSNIHKTLIDAILYPDFFGGTENVNRMIESYKAHSEKNYEVLKKYALRAKNAMLAQKIREITATK